jgi:succinate dehydrogenase hydrophobic anchor subunit
MWALIVLTSIAFLLSFGLTALLGRTARRRKTIVALGAVLVLALLGLGWSFEPRTDEPRPDCPAADCIDLFGRWVDPLVYFAIFGWLFSMWSLGVALGGPDRDRVLAMAEAERSSAIRERVAGAIGVALFFFSIGSLISALDAAVHGEDLRRRGVVAIAFWTLFAAWMVAFAIAHFRKTMRRPWPKVPPAETDDE